MKQSNVAKFAYLAGLVDGEGMITIGRGNHPKGGPNYFVTLGVVNRDGTIMDWLKGNFGGSIYSKSNKGFNGVRVPIYEWRAYRRDAVPVVRRILPFLRIKKRQAQIWLRMAERFSHRGGSVGRPGSRTVSPEEVAVREKLFEECRSLKHHFPISKLAVGHPMLPGG